MNLVELQFHMKRRNYNQIFTISEQEDVFSIQRRFKYINNLGLLLETTYREQKCLRCLSR